MLVEVQFTHLIRGFVCRHILLSASVDFTESMWQIIIDGLQHALDVKTYNVRQLLSLFFYNGSISLILIGRALISDPGQVA